MRPSAHRRARGFTLSELLVGLVVTSIVLAATTAAFIAVQRSWQAETEHRVLIENGRATMLFLERVLPLTGYGVDPRVAIDVSLTSTLDNQAVQGVAFTPAQPVLPGVVVSDDLAIRFRDPAFLRAGRLNTGGTSLSLDAPLGVALPGNKLLMVGCRGGNTAAYVRVGAAGALATATSVTVSAAGAPFAAESDPCLTQTGDQSPWVFVVQEHRLRIVNLGGRPWLVSFRNLEANVTDLTLDNFDPIAPDVEHFQVAFSMNRARPGAAQVVPDASGNSNFVVGDAPGETFFAAPGGLLTSRPDYRTPYLDPSRYVAHPANIRAIEVQVVMRASRRAPDGRQFPRIGALGNWSGTVTNDGFRRSPFHTAIETPNLLSRSGFTPALRTAADLRDLNSWGG